MKNMKTLETLQTDSESWQSIHRRVSARYFAKQKHHVALVFFWAQEFSVYLYFYNEFLYHQRTNCGVENSYLWKNWINAYNRPIWRQQRNAWENKSIQLDRRWSKRMSEISHQRYLVRHIDENLATKFIPLQSHQCTQTHYVFNPISSRSRNLYYS